MISYNTIKNVAKSISNARLVLRPEFFEDGNNGFSDEEMEQLRAIAGQCVQQCVVR